MDLRRHQRFPIRLSGTVTGSSFNEAAGMTVNLSRQGCLLEIASPVNTGDVVSLHISLPAGESPIHIDQATVRWNLVGKIGLGFTAVAPSQQARLDQLLAQWN